MDKRIVYTDSEGLKVVIPSPRWLGTLEELAEKDVPAGCKWRVVDLSQIPSSRNWRNAWIDGSEFVSVDLEKAKEVHKELIIAKAHERVEPDSFGQKDFNQVKLELENINFNSISTLQELYNTFPPSIDRRNSQREYKMHEVK